jgi:cytochrome c biogenesis protein CcmG, thiol:disulfide interchange protein DsbE
MIRFALPLGVFAMLVALLWVGLGLDPRKLPSPLIDRPAPQFSLPTLHDAGEEFSTEQMAGQVWVFNIWASWCVSCRHEHPVLIEMARTGGVPIVGLNYKDTRGEALRYLRHGGGDPYTAIAFDEDGRVGIEWGVYGTPETFVIDRKGVIRYKHVGPLHRQLVEQEILPLVRKLEAEAA